MMLRMSLLASALLLITAVGCTSEPSAPANSGGGSGGSSAAAPVKTPKVSLAPAGEATPPLDGGRVQSNMPQGWKFLPRSSDYLFAAYLEDKSGIPRLVLRESAAGDLPETSSAEAAKKLVAKITQEVGSDKDAALTVVNIGDRWFVRYEKAMKFRGLEASGVTLETVRAGNRYSIELLTYSVDKEKYLPALYRFAADLKVEATEEPQAEEPKAEEESDTKEASDPEEGSSPDELETEPVEEEQ